MYDYQTERPKLFTEDGVRKLIEVRDLVKTLIDSAGAFRGDKIKSSGDSWLTLAILDYLVETEELVKLRPDGSCWAQYQVFTVKHVVR